MSMKRGEIVATVLFVALVGSWCYFLEKVEQVRVRNSPSPVPTASAILVVPSVAASQSAVTVGSHASGTSTISAFASAASSSDQVPLMPAVSSGPYSEKAVEASLRAWNEQHDKGTPSPDDDCVRTKVGVPDFGPWMFWWTDAIEGDLPGYRNIVCMNASGSTLGPRYSRRYVGVSSGFKPGEVPAQISSVAMINGKQILILDAHRNKYFLNPNEVFYFSTDPSVVYLFDDQAHLMSKPMKDLGVFQAVEVRK